MAMRWLLDPIQRIFPGFTRENLLAVAAKRSLDRAETPPEVPEEAPIYVAGYFRSHAGIASGARAQLAAFRREERAAFGIDLTAAMGQAETLPFDGEVYDCRSLPEDGAPGTVVVYQNPRWFLIALARMGGVSCGANVSSATGHGSWRRFPTGGANRSTICTRYGCRPVSSVTRSGAIRQNR